MKIITSTSNETFKNIKKLLEPKSTRKTAFSLCFGEKLVRDVIVNHKSLVRDVIRTPEQKSPSTQHPEIVLSPALFKQIDVFSTKSAALVVKAPEIQNWEPNKHSSDFFLLTPFQDPGNMGTCLRTAAAFGWENIILSPECANPFSPKVIRAASGAHFGLKYFFTDDFNFGIPVFGLDMNGENIKESSIKAPCVLAPGIEGQGLNNQINYSKLFSIPMTKNVNSLNATIATAIALYEFSKKNFRN